MCSKQKKSPFMNKLFTMYLPKINKQFMWDDSFKENVKFFLTYELLLLPGSVVLNLTCNYKHGWLLVCMCWLIDIAKITFLVKIHFYLKAWIMKSLFSLLSTLSAWCTGPILCMAPASTFGRFCTKILNFL